MKKTIVTMAALMLMAGSAFACAQQPEKKDASAATEAAAPATESPATDGQEKSESGDADKTDSTAGESAKEENKNESTSTSGEEVNKQIWQMDALQMALEVVKREHPGYGPHYWEIGIVSEGEPRWAFIFLKLKDPNVQDIGDTEIIGQVGYTVNERTGEVKQEDWLVQ